MFLIVVVMVVVIMVCGGDGGGGDGGGGDGGGDGDGGDENFARDRSFLNMSGSFDRGSNLGSCVFFLHACMCASVVAIRTISYYYVLFLVNIYLLNDCYRNRHDHCFSMCKVFTHFLVYNLCTDTQYNISVRMAIGQSDVVFAKRTLIHMGNSQNKRDMDLYKTCSSSWSPSAWS